MVSPGLEDLLPCFCLNGLVLVSSLLIVLAGDQQGIVCKCYIIVLLLRFPSNMR
jgi:hypothetical protein